MTRILGYLVVATLFTLSGCKLAVIVVEGGEVQSLASGTCQPTAPGLNGNVCIHEITDTAYSETFTAVPDTGWQFVKWSSGDGFLCADSTDSNCVADNTLFSGNPAAETIVASDATYYLMPVFTEVGIPITDTVTVEGNEWAQPDLFTNLSWNEIDAVCPQGVCAGMLKGFDLRGWIWASPDNMNELFNYYIGSNQLGPGPDVYLEIDSLWAPAFFSDGWRPSVVETDRIRTIGMVADDCDFQGATGPMTEFAYMNDSESQTDYAATRQEGIECTETAPSGAWGGYGAWFYRDP